MAPKTARAAQPPPSIPSAGNPYMPDVYPTTQLTVSTVSAVTFIASAVLSTSLLAVPFEAFLFRDQVKAPRAAQLDPKSRPAIAACGGSLRRNKLHVNCGAMTHDVPRVTFKMAKAVTAAEVTGDALVGWDI